jgi:hypothetical protein
MFLDVILSFAPVLSSVSRSVRYVTLTHILRSSDTVKDCAPAVVHACLTMLGAICRMHSVIPVVDAARNWARLCEALASVHLKSILKQVKTSRVKCFCACPCSHARRGSMCRSPSKRGCDCERRCWFPWSSCSLLKAASLHWLAAVTKSR